MALHPVEHSIPTPATPIPQSRKRTNPFPYLFIAPFFVLFSIFFLVPSVFALVLSFFRWNAIGAPRWAGVTNYTRLLADPVFWQSVRNTAVYMVASLFIVMPLAVILAAVLNSPRLRLRGLWRTMFISPIVTSSVAITLVFVLLYSKDYGLLNYFLRLLGLPPVNWLGDRSWAKPAIIGLILWRWTGYNMIYFLAGMQSISLEYYEAAQIDGASAMQQFFGITIPLLRPVIVYVSIVTMIGSAQIFDETFILTQGGPSNATISVAQYLYTRGIARLEFGYASAIGLLLFIVIFLLSLTQLRSLRGAN